MNYTELKMNQENLADLVQCGNYFKNLPHQIQALQYLQKNTSLEVLREFTKIWRATENVVDLKLLAGLESVIGQGRVQTLQQKVLVPVQSYILKLQNGKGVDLKKLIYNSTQSVPEKVLEEHLKYLIPWLEKFEINTKLRVIHFLAQTLHESCEFYYTEEIASGEDYEGRTDLGNVNPGDGRLYKGRGLIQVTGRYNYSQISRDFGIDFIETPYALATVEFAGSSAVWYWNSRGLNDLADNDFFDSITYQINGGYNGYNDRLNYLEELKNQWKEE